MTKKPTTQKIKFSIKYFFSKFKQIHKKMWILSYLLKFIFVGFELHFCLNWPQ